MTRDPERLPAWRLELRAVFYGLYLRQIEHLEADEAAELIVERYPHLVKLRKQLFDLRQQRLRRRSEAPDAG